MGLNGHVKCGRRLIGDEQLGAAREGHGNHHPLSHTTGHLVGVIVYPFSGFRYSNQLEHLRGHLHRLLFGFALVQDDSLGNLITDRINRV